MSRKRDAHRASAVNDDGIFAIREVLLQLDEESVFRIGVGNRDVEYGRKARWRQQDRRNGLDVVVFAEGEPWELLDGETLLQLIGVGEGKKVRVQMRTHKIAID